MNRLIPNFDEHISAAIRWFYDCCIEDTNATGWSHYSGNPTITEWGGTLDGIRALLYAGESRHHPKIVRSIEWLKGVQRSDGGWLSWEMKQSSVEVTAWVVITLKLAGESLTSESIQTGVSFLLNAQDSVGGWGAYKGAAPRIYPTLLSVWALSGLQNQAVAKGTKWLQEGVNSDGGWGFRYKDELSNVAMTSMVLYSLLTSATRLDLSLKERSVDWIKGHCGSDGLWEPVFEDWISYEDTDSHTNLPTRTDHFSSAWAILSLIKAGESVLDPILFRAICNLAAAQETNGAWAFVPYDQNRHTWCVANAVWALVDARNALYSPATHYQSMLNQASELQKLKKLIFSFAVLSCVSLAVNVVMIMYVTAEYKNLASGMSWVSHRVGSAVLNNLASFVIATLSATVAGYLVYRFTKRRTQSSILPVSPGQT